VLGGGGILGAVQVGQLKALLDAGIHPDVVVGASVGALNASAIAYEPSSDGVALLADVWTSLRSDDIFPGSWMQRAWHFVRRGDHLYSNAGIRGLIARVPATRFEQLQVPLSVVAANLRTGAEHWFDSGAIEPALLASTALPGIFPPVQVDGELLVDGGVVNNVPISRAVSLGATRIYVLRCGSIRTPERPIRRPLDVLMTAVAHSRGVRVELDVTRYATMAEIHMLPAYDPGIRRFDDPSRSTEMIERARELAGVYLEHPRAILASRA
jgi:NTE family protein